MRILLAPTSPGVMDKRTWKSSFAVMSCTMAYSTRGPVSRFRTYGGRIAISHDDAASTTMLSDSSIPTGRFNRYTTFSLSDFARSIPRKMN